MRERFTPLLMHAFSHLVPRDSQVKWSCRGPKPPPQSSHQGNWYPTCLTSRPCIKTYTVALNSGHRVRRARNLPGGSPVNVQELLGENCVERDVDRRFRKVSGLLAQRIHLGAKQKVLLLLLHNTSLDG